MSKNKGNSVEYSTFFSSRLTDIIACKNKLTKNGKHTLLQSGAKLILSTSQV